MKAKKKILSVAVLLLTVCLVAIAMATTASADSTLITDAPLTAGRAFEDGEGIQLGKELTDMPKTYEAVVYVPSDVTEKGAIISNYHPLGSTLHIDFAIVIGGSAQEARPLIDITDQNNNRTRIEFRSNIKSDSWAHVVITHEVKDTGDVYTCYVNGEKVSKQNPNYWVDGVKSTDAVVTYKDFDMSKLENSASMYLGQAYGYSSATELGADDPYNAGKAYEPTNFKGRIKNVALYSGVLTAAEIKANYQSGINAERDDIILCYDLTSTETSGETKSGYISDISGNGYDTVPLFHERGDELNKDDFDYSFAILGDTQFLVDWDLKNGTSYSSDIYNWIVANKDAKKIARVLGVGDIVESGRLDAEVTDAAAREFAVQQWEYAVSQHAKLEAAGIPYTITWGYNHDGYYGEEFTTYFGNSTNFTNSDIGYYFSDPDSADYNKRLANYYQRFEIEAKGEKIQYLVMCIEYRPSNAVLSWADAVIKANPNARVIISTHYFLNQYGEISQEYAEIQPKWDVLANENKNVEMIICGHVARQNNIVKAYTVAKSGQTVAQFLIDPQQMDRFYGYDDTGVVAMFYFSNGGNDVRVEFVSTTRTARAQVNDPEADDVLYGAQNEFTYKVNELPKTVTTEYGVIPEEYASTEEYPFVIFDNNKNFVGAAAFFNGNKDDNNSAMGKAKTYLKVNVWDTEKNTYGKDAVSVIILMRRDVVMDSIEDYYNQAQSQGLITIDLCGNKLTAPADKNIFSFSHKQYNSSGDAYIFPTYITVKNGNIAITNKSVIAFSTNSSGEGKTYECKFKNVNFTVLGSAASIISCGTGTSFTFDPTVEFTDCTFDLSAATSTVTLFHLGNSEVSVHYTVKGGSITTNKANYDLVATAKSGSRGDVYFDVSDSTNTYTTLVLPTSVSISTDKFNGGSYYFKKKSTENDTVTYALYTKLGNYGEASLDDISTYAFLIFDSNNKLVKKSNIFYGSASSSSAIHLAKEFLKTNKWVEQADGSYIYEGETAGSDPVGCTIVLTRNYAMTSDETFSNLAQIQGTLTIDLAGYTFSAYESTSIFPTSLKKWTASGDAEIFPSEIRVINGSINVYNSAIIKYSLNSNGPGKEFNFTFENVKIYAKGTAANPIVEQPSATSTAYSTAVTLVNCTIDITGSKASSLTLFNLGNKSTNTNVNVYGGSIISADKEFDLWSRSSGSGTAVFHKYEGEYTVIKSNGFVASDSVMNNDGIECVFVKKAENGTLVTLVLCPKVMADYKIKTSVTLYSNFIYNIYIPKENAKEFLIDGNSVKYVLKNVDGVEYYHVTLNLPIGEALSDISLKVTLSSGDKTIDVSWTLSLLKYTKNVLSSKCGAITKTLMKDMLVYASKAYDYFENELDSEKATDIAKILDGYTREIPNGEAKTMDKTCFTDVVVYVGATPSFRFYLADGYAKDDFSFRVGGKNVDVTLSDDGKYLEISIYAYMMLDDVIFTVKDTGVTGTYNLYSYLDYAKNTLKDESLVAIVEGLMKYSASAKDYKESVSNVNAVTGEIVNKNGASGAVSFVIDDGDQNTASFLQEMMIKYPTLALTFAVPVKKLATLAVEDADGNGIPNYVMANGKYVYEVNKDTYEFWCDILSSGNAEITNHSFTHGYFGSNDNGGSFEYVKNNSIDVITSEVMPEGSVTKEIYASKQILEELFADYISDNNTVVTYIGAGIGVRTSNFTLTDGTVIVTYKLFMDEVVRNAYENGDLVGASTTFGQNYSATLDLLTKVVTAENFDDALRLMIPRYMIEYYNANPEALVNGDITNWTDFIDAAVEKNGWVSFCIHKIKESAPTSTSDHIITEAQAEMLFEYAIDNNLWIATNTEAILYFSEWASASVICELVQDKIVVSVADDENDEIYNMPLTVKVNIPDGWEKVTVDGRVLDILTDSDGNEYVLVDVVPDGEAVVLARCN